MGAVFRQRNMCFLLLVVNALCVVCVLCLEIPFLQNEGEYRDGSKHEKGKNKESIELRHPS